MNLTCRMWNEEEGVLSFEWTLLVTLLVLGIVGGLAGARDAIIDPQEHRRPGQCQHRMPCRNPGRAFARHQRLAAPDRKHRPRREGFCQTRIIAPQTCASVKRRATEGYCFCDLHAGLTFDRLFA